MITLNCSKLVVYGSQKRKQQKTSKKGQDPWQNINDPYTAWLKSRGLPTQKVKAENILGKGKGLVAMKEINKGETTLSIPKNLLITAERAIEELPYGDEVRDLPVWSILALYLIELRKYYRSTQLSNQNGSSEIVKKYEDAPYISILPDKTGCVFEWGDIAEVKNVVGCSPSIHLALEVLKGLEDTWEELKPRIQKLQLGMQKEDVVWSLSIILTRIVRLPRLDDKEVLIPWADFANHSPYTKAHFDFSPNTNKKMGGAVVLKTDKNVKARGELTISYGDLTNAQAMIQYGFVIQDNPGNAVEMEVELKKNDRYYKEKAAALQQIGWNQLKCNFPIRENGVTIQFLAFVAFCECKIKDKEDIEELVSFLFKQGEFPLLDGVDLKLLAFQKTLQLLKQQLKRYNIASDDKLEGEWIQMQKSDKNVLSSEYRKLVWAKIRVDERKIFEVNISKIESTIKQLKSTKS